MAMQHNDELHRLVGQEPLPAPVVGLLHHRGDVEDPLVPGGAGLEVRHGEREWCKLGRVTLA